MIIDFLSIKYAYQRTLTGIFQSSLQDSSSANRCPNTTPLETSGLRILLCLATVFSQSCDLLILVFSQNLIEGVTLGLKLLNISQRTCSEATLAVLTRTLVDSTEGETP